MYWIRSRGPDTHLLKVQPFPDLMTDYKDDHPIVKQSLVPGDSFTLSPMELLQIAKDISAGMSYLALKV